jgi:proline dehydrogenase
MLRALILAASRSPRVEHLVGAAPLARDVVARFVAGQTADEAVVCIRRLVRVGLLATVDYLGEDVTDAAAAEGRVDAYAAALTLLRVAGLAPRAELSVKLSALGRGLDEGLALVHARRICAIARQAGTSVTIDMEDHTTTDSTLAILAELRRDYPETGVALQSYLRRSVTDCRNLAVAGSRVRLCKGAYAEPGSVAYQTRTEVDRSYARCLAVLMGGPGYPMVATHDPRLVQLALRLGEHLGRSPDSWELQMLYGVRPREQRRLAVLGHRVRVYVPYGDQWYEYLMRRLAERPANLVFAARALAGRS